MGPEADTGDRLSSGHEQVFAKDRYRDPRLTRTRGLNPRIKESTIER